MSGTKALFTAAVLALLAAANAHGHGMHLFAAMEGGVIQGRLTFADGTPGQEVLITITGQTSAEKAQVATDERGTFTFDPRSRQDYLFEAQTKDGHYARYTVSAAELPEALPRSHTTDGAEAAARENGVAAAEIERLVEESVSRQVAPLRRDLAAYRESVRFHDVIGGIGYIVGLAGLWALWRARTAQGKRT